MNKDKYTRLLPIEGAYNVRDLGGYPTKGGKQVKWRKLLRSGALNELTLQDLNYLKDIPVITDIDFRSFQEKEAAPDKRMESLKEYVWLPVDAGDMNDIKVTDVTLIPKMMEEAYRTIIRKFQNEYKRFFEILINRQAAPLLFHCSAGKDRTGIAAALLLSALGVDKETVMQDYLLSAEYIKGKYDFLIRMQPALEPLTTVRPEYLEAALQVIDKEFGGMEQFLHRNLNVDSEKLKELYTE